MVNSDETLSCGLQALLGDELSCITLGRYQVQLQFDRGGHLSTLLRFRVGHTGGTVEEIDAQRSAGSISIDGIFGIPCSAIDLRGDMLRLSFGDTAYLEIDRLEGGDCGTFNIAGDFYVL